MKRTAAATYAAMALGTAILLLISVFLPPLGAFLRFGLESEFWISLLLTILGWLPGVVYTLYVILSRRHISAPPVQPLPPPYRANGHVL